jgi:hypothetical protein
MTKVDRHVSDERYLWTGLPMIGICILIMITPASCVSPPQTPAKDEPLFGTWFAKELVGTQLACKFSYRPDGTTIEWTAGRLPDQPNNYEGRFSIAKKWRDSKGNSWYKVSARSCMVPYVESKTTEMYALVEVHVDGRVLEGEWSTTDFPPEFGAHYHYVFQRES